MMYFNIPGMYEHKTFNFKFLSLLKACPDWFYPNAQVECCYGNFQFCLFDGGRIFTNYQHTTKEEIENTIQRYNEEFNIPIRLVFTNNQLKPEHYKNRFGNEVLKICENGLNEIAIADPEFQKYIEDTYPKYKTKFVSSTTKCITNKDLLKEELNNNNYKLVCLDYNLNKNKTLLESLNQDEKDKCEFLINAICPPGCPNRKEHYRLNSLYHLSFGKPMRMLECPIHESNVHPNNMSNKNNLSPEEIFEYEKMGFSHFKIEGRTLPMIVNASHYVRYMAKPEYQYQILATLFETELGVKY